MTIATEMNARRIVSSRMQAYFAIVKEQLFLSSADFYKKLEDDLTLTETRDNLR